MKRPLRPFIIDVEASGFGPEGYPIEIGLALDEDERYCTLISPCKGWTHWDEKAESVHHITRQTLVDHGRPAHEVARALNDLLGRITVYSDAWGVDKPWVSKLFYTVGIRQKFFISPLEKILTDSQMSAWHETKNEIVAEKNFRRHRASMDALIIQQTYIKTLSDSR